MDQIQALQMDNDVYKSEVERLRAELKEARGECEGLSNRVGDLEYKLMQSDIQVKAKANRVLYLEESVRRLNMDRQETGRIINLKDERIRLLEELGRRRIDEIDRLENVVGEIRRLVDVDSGKVLGGSIVRDFLGDQSKD